MEFRQIGLKLLKQELPNNYAIKLENAIYEYVNKYRIVKKIDNSYLESIYMHKLNDINYNLDQFNNPSFLIKIIKKEIDIEKIPYMLPQELYEKHWEIIIKRMELSEQKRNYCEESSHVCKKCKNNKCKMYKLQTRSADEPMTTFILCTVCNFLEKF